MNIEEQIPNEALPPHLHKADVGRSFLSIVDEYVLSKESKFQLQYVDYEDNQWTIPVLLTAERAYRFKNDKSVKMVRIIWRSVSFEIEPS